MVAAGGTGGHLFPAEALARELQSRGWRIVLATDARGARYAEHFPSEERLALEAATFKLSDPVGVVRGLLRIEAGVRQARKAFQRLRPGAVVGFGGYPSVAPLLGARLLGRRRPAILLHEGNAVLGQANAFLARSAAAVAGSVADTARRPHAAGRVRLTGMPVRPDIGALAASPYPHAGETIELLVWGGSLGARVFSDVVPAVLSALAPAWRPRLRVTQQARAEDVERVRDAYAAAGIEAEIAPFLDRIARRLAKAHLVIGRAGGTQQALALGEVLSLGDVRVWLQPAGDVLGSAQVAMEYRGSRAVVSGDYKRVADPTCLPFEPIACDVFVTEATFGLPVFRHPPPAGEVERLLESVRLFPERTHVIGCYALGKCQRLIALLRQGGWDAPIHLHGALIPLCEAYGRMGVELGPLRPATVAAKAELTGAIVLAPPSAIADRWARRLADPVTCLASGWMRVRQRARAKGIELPLVISDHADWDELCATLDAVDAPEIWVTHGREEALIHEAAKQGRRGRALRLIGYGDDDEVGDDVAGGHDA